MAILITLELNAPHSTSSAQLEGFDRAYFLFKFEGMESTLASHQGGWPWPAMNRDIDVFDRLQSFAAGSAAREELADTIRVDQVCVDDFECAYCVGATGRSGPFSTLLNAFLASGKPVAVFSEEFDMPICPDLKGVLILGGDAVLTAQTLLAATRAKAASKIGLERENN